MSARFVIEGVWNGRVLHRSVHPASSKALRDWAEKTGSITWQSGKKLLLTVRDTRDNETDTVLIDDLSTLISECARHGVGTVDELLVARKDATDERLGMRIAIACLIVLAVCLIARYAR